jgi:hypothetical protein
MTREELIAAILRMVHCGDPDVEDTDIGSTVSEIRLMDDVELGKMFEMINEFGDHIDNL